jgi:hypothetical protein
MQVLQLALSMKLMKPGHMVLDTAKVKANFSQTDGLWHGLIEKRSAGLQH